MLDGRGKSGSIRVINVYKPLSQVFYMLYAYDKRTEKGIVGSNQGADMKDSDFKELVNSAKEAVAISKGEEKPSRVFEYSPLNVKQIRESAGKSQQDFAHMIGVSTGTLRNWEQGRRFPDGAARALLKVVAADPAYVEKVLYN